MEGEMISGSNCSNNTLPAGNPPRNGNRNSSKFKGIVLQPNGHCGAQIYANQQRIWLGTFKSETEAAMAYDSAAIKIRSRDSSRNIPLSNITVREPDFQAQYSGNAVLNMIKDGSYQSRFADYLRDHFQSQRPKEEEGADDGSLCLKLLFQKELTPSDVGKLNRLVIPKKYAVQYLPPISEDGGGGSGDMVLYFSDRLMRLWKFRYSYWSSSQSYVFTKGWSRFVREKGLKVKDVIKFFLCEQRGEDHNQNFCMIIDVHTGQQINAEDNVGKIVDLKLALGPDEANTIKDEEMVTAADSEMDLELHLALRPSGHDDDGVEAAKGHDEAEPAQGFTLFGVNMKKVYYSSQSSPCLAS